MKNRLLIISLLMGLLYANPSFAQGYFRVVDPVVDNMVTPLGLDELPVFGWSIESNVVGAGQSAYQIVICDKAGSKVWDTGKVSSSKTANVELDYNYASRLKKGTDYFWTVTVWDKKGKSYTTEPQRFSTGLAYDLFACNDTPYDNVKDAVFGPAAIFIGSPHVILDAASLTVYNMSYDIRLLPGTTRAGFVYGGNEMRFSSAMFNDYLIEGETYISVVLDISKLVEGKGPAQIKVYRKGYGPLDYERPNNTSLLKTYDLDNVTKENMYDKHTVYLSCPGGCLQNCTLDGVAFQKPDPPATNNMFGAPAGPAPAAANPMRRQAAPQLITNPLGRAGDSCKYPHLGEIGFCAEGDAVFSNVKVNYINQPASTVFGKNIGATYSIFKDLPGISVEGDEIKVSNTLAYADPSFGSEPMVRTTFDTSGEIEDAKLYVTSRGLHEFFINGERVESAVTYHKDKDGVEYHRNYLAPGMLQFYGTMRYSTYDVTKMLRNGANAMGAMMAPGWWGDEYVYSPNYFNWYGEYWGVLAKLVITYKDGRTQEIDTNDKDWKSFIGGPITYSSIYHGEFYDTEKEKAIEGWSTASYDDSKWERAAYTPTAHPNFNDPDYVGRVDYPVHVVEVRDGKHIGTPTQKFRNNPERVSFVFDMGENMVGVPEISFSSTLPKGTKVVLRYGETMVQRDFLYPFNAAQMDGMIYTENYRGARSIDRYIASGKAGGETWSPTFTFHGWRYIDVSLQNDDLSVAEQKRLLSSLKVKGLVLSSLTDITTTFTSSNPLLDRFFLNVARSHWGNHVSVGTDCPQRNERLPFLGDQQIYSETSVYMADMTQFYSNYAQLARDYQPNSPNRDYQASLTGRGAYLSKKGVERNPEGKATNVAWPMGGLTMIWDIYANNGDISALRESYPSFKLYTEQFINAGKQDPKYNYLFQGGGLSNHLEMSKSSNSGYDQICEFGRVLRYMATMADALGYKDDAAYYLDYFRKLRDEFNDNMISDLDIPLDYNGNPTTAQSSYAIAIYYDMIDYDKHPDFVKNYVERCQNEGTELTAAVNGVDMPLHEYSVTSGFTGTPCILGALGMNGEFYTAYKMLENEKYSSWLYPVTIGATSLWERWNTETEYGPINQSMNSWNHYGFGVAAAFMITQVGGIQRGANGIFDNVGFSNFILQPVSGGSLDHAKVDYKSSNGLIESGWTADPSTVDGHGVSDMKTYEAVVPANTKATLYLPVGKTFSLDAAKKFKGCAGVTYAGNGKRNGIDVLVFNLQAGGYDFCVEGGHLVASLKSGYTK